MQVPFTCLLRVFPYQCTLNLYKSIFINDKKERMKLTFILSFGNCDKIKDTAGSFSSVLVTYYCKFYCKFGSLVLEVQLAHIVLISLLCAVILSTTLHVMNIHMTFQLLFFLNYYYYYRLKLFSSLLLLLQVEAFFLIIIIVTG